MLQEIWNWLYENSMAIFISSMASLMISKRYYKKGNREVVLSAVVFPLIRLLEKRYSSVNYEKMFELTSNYAIKYLHKEERNKLLKLIDSYREVCRYDKDKANTDCIMSYYAYKLSENNIFPMPCPIRDDDGNIVGNDYPPNYNYLQNEVFEIVTSYDFVVSPQECTEKIVQAFSYYTREYYTEQEISFFNDYTVYEVIKQSEVTKKWEKRFETADQCKEDFLALPICKMTLEILHGPKVKNLN